MRVGGNKQKWTGGFGVIAGRRTPGAEPPHGRKTRGWTWIARVQPPGLLPGGSLEEIKTVFAGPAGRAESTRKRPLEYGNQPRAGGRANRRTAII